MLRDRNTMGETAFYLLSAFLMTLLVVIYVNVFALPMFAQSRLFAVALVEFGVYCAGIIVFSQRRNFMTALSVGLMAPILFYVLAYYHVAGVRIAVALGVGVGLSLAYAFIQIRFSRSSGGKKRRMILLGAVPLIVFSLGASMLIPAGDYSAFRQIEYSNNDEYAFTVYDEEKNLDHNMEAVSVLDSSIYPSLDTESRMDAVEALECVEANYLGIEPPAIEYADLGESTWGETDYEENTVRINAELLKDKTSENLVETLLHELYHVYTYRCIVLYNKLGKEDRGLLLFRVAEMCAQDFNNYESGEEDFEAYANQACEISARKYAEDGCAEIYERIGEYLEGKKNEE